MLAMADVTIADFLPVFANVGAQVAFLVPTPTGHEKSIMDATAPVRNLLFEAGVHDYSTQKQGPENKVKIPSFFVYPDHVAETEASLYRPLTKQGDPRIWFSNLKKYCAPCNLLALVISQKEIYVLNLSNPDVAASLFSGGLAHGILEESVYHENAIADELLAKIQAIHDRGFLPSITPGDPGVGDTLEHALGIERNNSRSPDYKGIELKTTRITRNGARRAVTRSTLFTKVPDIGCTYREIVEKYGKRQIPRGETEERLQLYETLRFSRPNAYDLILQIDGKNDDLCIMHQDANARRRFVSAWHMDTLKAALAQKHRETFWVKAVSEMHDGREFFRYDRILHTKSPNVSLIAPLIEDDKITVDLAAHFKADGSWRDHGILFKMLPGNLPLLLGEPKEYIL